MATQHAGNGWHGWLTEMTMAMLCRCWALKSSIPTIQGGVRELACAGMPTMHCEALL